MATATKEKPTESVTTEGATHRNPERQRLWDQYNGFDGWQADLKEAQEELDQAERDFRAGEIEASDRNRARQRVEALRHKVQIAEAARPKLLDTCQNQELRDTDLRISIHRRTLNACISLLEQRIKDNTDFLTTTIKGGVKRDCDIRRSEMENESYNAFLDRLRAESAEYEQRGHANRKAMIESIV